MSDERTAVLSPGPPAASRLAMAIEQGRHATSWSPPAVETMALNPIRGPRLPSSPRGPLLQPVSKSFTLSSKETTPNLLNCSQSGLNGQMEHRARLLIDSLLGAAGPSLTSARTLYSGTKCDASENTKDATPNLRALRCLHAASTARAPPAPNTTHKACLNRQIRITSRRKIPRQRARGRTDRLAIRPNLSQHLRATTSPLAPSIAASVKSIWLP
ncbi:hypothetical protein B0T11DRAFT_21591 [Plectosphaerella cucumerina]|uniref:Uncharacterized protein n=1 Tax=Plectosphaerella cucumerina TaxID=40658 RepID=A0A8K0TVZ2_9PEZI|nr:hypothetical protein B0T11DRAFT_21591 [Plectosphaerella cucumerina]